jgi:integrase
VPLLCLFQGLRMNEACRLYADDVSNQDGIWVLRIAHNLERNQRVKNEMTASVPMHPMLIQLGFPAFVLRSSSELFPELGLDAQGYASNYFSKWFASLQKSASIRRRGVHFHSFRHNFRDALRQARVPMDRSHALGRWSDGGSAAERYGEGFRPIDLAEDISLVEYPGLDIRHLIADHV